MCTTISKGNAYLCFVLFLFLARRQSRKPVEKLKMRKWVYRGPMLTLRQEQEQEQEQKLKQEEKVAKEAGKHCKMSAQANGARAPRQQTNKQHSKHECFVWYAVRRERDGARGRKRERARTEGKTTGARWVEKGRHAAGSRVYKLFSVSSKKKKKQLTRLSLSALLLDSAVKNSQVPIPIQLASFTKNYTLRLFFFVCFDFYSVAFWAISISML